MNQLDKARVDALSDALQGDSLQPDHDLTILALIDYWRENEALARESEVVPKEPVCRHCGKIAYEHKAGGFCTTGFDDWNKFEP